MVNDNRIMFFSDFLLLFLFCQVLFILTNFFCISAFSNLCSSYLRSSSVVRSSLRMASSDREGLWDMDLSSYLSHKEKDWETRSHIVSQGEGLWEKMSLQGAHGLHEKDLRVIVWSQSLKGRERKKNRESNEEAHFHRGRSNVSFRLSKVQLFQERSIISFPLFQELFTANELYQVQVQCTWFNLGWSRT